MDDHAREAIERIVAAGAEIEMRDPDAEIVFHGPLARHWRTDPEVPAGAEIVLVFRPLGRYDPAEDGRPHFDLTLHRPRRIIATRVDRLSRDLLGFPQTDGNYSVLKPATAAHRRLLEAWDVFWSDVLTETERAELDQLLLGDWYGT